MPRRKSLYNKRPRRAIRRNKTAGPLRRPISNQASINNNAIGAINNPGGISAGPKGGGSYQTRGLDYCESNSDCGWGGCRCQNHECYCGGPTYLIGHHEQQNFGGCNPYLPDSWCGQQ